jgi:ABC-type branched-subunit amino acid transport system ATPase component
LARSRTFCARKKGPELKGAHSRPVPRRLILQFKEAKGITEGIQPSIIKDIERAIRALAEEGSMAILLVEQYYDFARSLADQYLVMERGEIIKRGAGADMEKDGVRELLAV